MITPSPSKMLVEGDGVADAAEEIGEQMFTVLKPRPTEVFAVEFDRVEGAEHGCAIAKPITKSLLPTRHLSTVRPRRSKAIYTSGVFIIGGKVDPKIRRTLIGEQLLDDVCQFFAFDELSAHHLVMYVEHAHIEHATAQLNRHHIDRGNRANASFRRQFPNPKMRRGAPI